MNRRANALADRLEQGARNLMAVASALTDAEWQTRIPKDGRKVGVVVHHVASVYPIEIGLAQTLAAGKPVTGVTMDNIHEMNAKHAQDFDGVTKQAALDLLERNSAAAAIRALTDEQLDMVAPLSLDSDGPRSCPYMLEGHAVGHAWHHLNGIKKALAARETAGVA